MRIKPLIIFLLAFAASLNQVNAQQIHTMLRPLKPLLGSWEMTSPNGRIIEVWTYDSPAKFAGKSFRIGPNNDTTLLEEVEIIHKQGKLYYIPTVVGQNEGKPVEFALKSKGGGVFIFENKLHDFPQRVCYQLQSENDLLAWIEGSKNGKDRRSEFRYRRVGSR
jgi:hypothetical protein